MKRTHSGLLYVIALSIPLLFSFNNCGKSNLKSSDVATLDAASTGGSEAPIVATPSPTVSAGSSPSVGLPLIANNADWPTDNNCMNNNNYDTCLVWKNPVAHRLYKSGSSAASIFTNSSGISQKMKRGTDLSAITTLAVNMGKYSGSNGLLKNSFIDVYASNLSTNPISYLRALPVSGKYKQAYASDTNYNFAQYMAFYWINYAREFFEKRGAVYHSAMFMSGKPAMPVDAFNSTDKSLVNNGYFTWSSSSPYGLVALGSVRSDSAQAVVDHEVAMSAEAYVHEMGHANLFYASGGPTNATYGYDDNLLEVTNSTKTVRNYICASSAGCRTAIDEGQADFHSHILFERQPYLLETFANLATGDSKRNATYINSFTTGQSWYDSATFSMNSTTYKGEIHYMGALYASMLYNIYANAATDKNKFVKVFSASLKMIDQTSTFPKMKQALIQADSAISGPSLANIISAEFTKRGY